MSTVKQEAALLIERLSDQATWDDLMYRIYVHQKVATVERPIPARGRRGLVASGIPEGETFSRRWRGTFEPAERDDERYRALAKKYL